MIDFPFLLGIFHSIFAHFCPCVPGQDFVTGLSILHFFRQLGIYAGPEASRGAGRVVVTEACCGLESNSGI